MDEVNFGPKTLGFPASSPPGPIYVLKSYLSVNPKDTCSFERSPDHPQDGYVFPPPSALKAGTSPPFSLWGYFVYPAGPERPRGTHVLSIQVACSTWHRP